MNSEGNWFDWPVDSASFAWKDAAGFQQSLRFDLVESEEWTEAVTVSEHPVEIGADVADHVRVQLVKCTLKVHSTNEPIDDNQFTHATLGPTETSSLMPLGFVPGPGIVRVPQVSFVPGTGLILVPQVDNPITLRALAGTLVGLAGNLAGQTAADLAGLAGAAAASLLFPPVIVGAPGGLPVPTSAGLASPPATPGGLSVQTTAGLASPKDTPNTVVQVQQWPTPPVDFVQATHQALLALKKNAQILQVNGTKNVNSSMVIESLTFTRNAETGTGEDITIALKEIRRVLTQTVAAPIPALPAGGGTKPKDKGAVEPKPVAADPSEVLRLLQGNHPSSMLLKDGPVVIPDDSQDH
jgi:hypothetical protein